MNTHSPAARASVSRPSICARLLAASLLCGSLAGADILYSNFNSTTGLKLVGAAAPQSPLLALTPNVASETGAAWYEVKQFVVPSFETTFEFRIVSGGADGMAFVIQNEAPDAIGFCGGGQGFGENPGGVCTSGKPTSIQNALAVEFDTYSNSTWGDPNGNHVAVMSGTANSNLADHSNALGQTIPTFTLNDGAIHTALIRYQQPTFEVFVDDLVTPLISITVDLDSILNLDGGRAWVGFTAGTGGVTQTHAVRSWSFSEPTGTYFFGSTDQLSLATGGSCTFSLSADTQYAGLPYLMLGSLSGTSPGFPVSGLQLPLNLDAYWLYTLSTPNSPPLSNSFGLLDASGKATASFDLPAGANPILLGLTAHHAFLVIELLPTLLHVVHVSAPHGILFGA